MKKIFLSFLLVFFVISAVFSFASCDDNKLPVAGKYYLSGCYYQGSFVAFDDPDGYYSTKSYMSISENEIVGMVFYENGESKIYNGYLTKEGSSNDTLKYKFNIADSSGISNSYRNLTYYPNSKRFEMDATDGVKFCFDKEE